MPWGWRDPRSVQRQARQNLTVDLPRAQAHQAPWATLAATRPAEPYALHAAEAGGRDRTAIMHNHTIVIAPIFHDHGQFWSLFGPELSTIMVRRPHWPGKSRRGLLTMLADK